MRHNPPLSSLGLFVVPFPAPPKGKQGEAVRCAANFAPPVLQLCPCDTTSLARRLAHRNAMGRA